MKIAYISLHWPRTLASGVGQKIQSQINAWKEAGHEVRLFMHTLRYERMEELLHGELFPYAAGSRLSLEFSRIAAAGRLVAAVRLFAPHLVYLRYGIYVYPIHRLASIGPVVEDVTTNDLVQHRRLGVPFDLYNRLTRGLLLHRVSGLVTISHELSRSPAFSRYGKPVITIANGVNLADFRPLPAPSNKLPSLVFIGNPVGALWQGVDKLATLASLCPEIHIDVIGYDKDPWHREVPGNLSFHGYMAPEGYRSILARSDVAISSLAIHRYGLEEQSPLKSREYLAHGLPMVMSYTDTDLSDLNCDFLLTIPNREDNIQTHAAAIRDFAYRMRGKRVDRSLVASRIDQRAKEEQRLNFFKEVIRGEVA